MGRQSSGRSIHRSTITLHSQKSILHQISLFHAIWVNFPGALIANTDLTIEKNQTMTKEKDEEVEE